jgi:hypothetical protein
MPCEGARVFGKLAPLKAMDHDKSGMESQMLDSIIDDICIDLVRAQSREQV